MKKLLFGMLLFFVSMSVFSAGLVTKYGGGSSSGSFIKAYITSEPVDEFDPALNPDPNNYYWCGHAAYKVAVDASTRHRENYTLVNFHNIFMTDSYYEDSLNCGGYDTKKYCASFQNLEQANNYYGFNNSHESYPSTYVNMFSQIKDSIDNGYPVITPWPYIYSGGHFWTIIGYYDHTDNSKDKIYLRDVANPVASSIYEESVHPHVFWSNGYNSGGRSMHLLFINAD